MNYERSGSKIIIYDLEDFNAEHILDCGQVFRYRNDGDCHTVFSKNKICLLQKEKDCVIIETEDTDYFVNYFDLNCDYGAIKEKLAAFKGLKESLEYGKGIRILNQDPFETIISFIISANNNIPRIKGIIERICENLGEKKDGYYAFPTPEKFAQADEKFFKEIGCGYRAAYLDKAGKQLLEGGCDRIRDMGTSEARKSLMTIMGVGQKVADCILLFSMGKTDIFPVDTWSKKIYNALGFEEEQDVKKMAERLVGRFGELSGYAQQYLYYYYRNNNIK